MEWSAIIQKIYPKTLNKVTLSLVTIWIVFGSVLIGTFSDMESNEPRFDFGCDGKVNIDKDFLRGICYDQYWIQNHKLGFPPSSFVLVNVLLIPIVIVMYSLWVNSTVKELQRNSQNGQVQPRHRDRRPTLFMAYLCQLIISFAVEITSIVLLESHLFYPTNFPSNFSCSIENSWSVNGTQSVTLFKCSTRRARDKNVWIRVVIVVNGMFALFAFLEIIWILSRGRHGKEFMENWRFYADHLMKANSNEQRHDQAHGRIPHGIPFIVESQHRAVNISHEPRDDEITNPSEHQEHAQTDGIPIVESQDRAVNITHEPRNDEITNPSEHQEHAQAKNYRHSGQTDGIPLVESQDRAANITHEPSNYDITNSSELQEHAQARNDLHRAIQIPGNDLHRAIQTLRKNFLQDILDENNKIVLVVGRLGIGKTSLTTKLLRLWAPGEASKSKCQ